MRLCLSANYVSGCPPNMAQVSVWAGNLQWFGDKRSMASADEICYNQKTESKNISRINHYAPAADAPAIP